jgi:hypothetical protein
MQKFHRGERRFQRKRIRAKQLRTIVNQWLSFDTREEAIEWLRGRSYIGCNCSKKTHCRPKMGKGLCSPQLRESVIERKLGKLECRKLEDE